MGEHAFVGRIMYMHTITTNMVYGRFVKRSFGSLFLQGIGGRSMPRIRISYFGTSYGIGTSNLTVGSDQ
jgi:hypothetical protein